MQIEDLKENTKIFISNPNRMENMADAMEKMSRGYVQPVIDREVGMDNLDEALTAMENRNVFGKIVLRISE